MKKEIKTINDENTEEVYQKIFVKMTSLLEENDAMVVASTMLAQSLRLYKTIMPENEFEKLLEFMSSSDHKNIQPFDAHSRTLH